MVGDDAVDGAVEDALAQRGGVVGGAQRRVHLEVRVVGVGDVVLAQEQVVRGDLAGDGQAVGLGGADEVEALARGDVADVQRAVGKAHELDVAVDLELLGQRRPAEHAEARGGAALVDDAVARERLDLAVGKGDAVELRDVLHAGAHHAGGLDTVAVVGEGAGALDDHVADLGQGLALLAARHGADGAHVAQAGGVGAVDLVADLGAGVGDGVGVGHGGNVGEAAVDRGRGAGLDGLLVLEAGVAEVYVHVHESGNEVLVVGVDDLGAGGGLEGLGDGGDLAVLDQNVAEAVEAHLRVDDVGALKQKCHCSLLPAAGTSRPCG